MIIAAVMAGIKTRCRYGKFGGIESFGGTNMEEKIYSIYMIGRGAVCPACSGMLLMQGQENALRCVDCRTRYFVKRIGWTEREFICTE